MEQRWDADVISSIKSTPRYPDPKNHDKGIEAKNDEEIVADDGKT